MASGRDGGPHRRRANVSLACCRLRGPGPRHASAAPPRRPGRAAAHAQASEEARVCAEVAGNRQAALLRVGVSTIRADLQPPTWSYFRGPLLGSMHISVEEIRQPDLPWCSGVRWLSGLSREERKNSRTLQGRSRCCGRRNTLKGADFKLGLPRPDGSRCDLSAGSH